MKSKLTILSIIFLVFAGAYFTKQFLRSDHTQQNHKKREPDRIVSLAPSVTELLFQLGQGNKVTGVTRFCDYPPEAKNKKKIGGFLDPNYEAIVKLSPDLVVLLTSSQRAEKHLNNLGFKTLSVDHESIDGIMDSIRVVAKGLGIAEKGEALVNDLNNRLDRVRKKNAEVTPQKVLISIDRPLGINAIKDVYIAGNNGFYDKMLEIAGAFNAYKKDTPKFPLISAEGILKMNPDVIIDVCSDPEDFGINGEIIKSDWLDLAQLKAVKNKRIFVFKEDYITIPGPRFILTVEKMAELLRSEASRQKGAQNKAGEQDD